MAMLTNDDVCNLARDAGVEFFYLPFAGILGILKRTAIKVE